MTVNVAMTMFLLVLVRTPFSTRHYRPSRSSLIRLQHAPLVHQSGTYIVVIELVYVTSRAGSTRQSGQADTVSQLGSPAASLAWVLATKLFTL